jgi:hypothetical protein
MSSGGNFDPSSYVLSVAVNCWDYVCPQQRRHWFYTKDLCMPKTIFDIKEKQYVIFAMYIIILVSWRIWMIKSNKIFQVEDP